MRSTENLLQRMLKTEEGIIILVSGFLLILAFVKKSCLGDFFDIFLNVVHASLILLWRNLQCVVLMSIFRALFRPCQVLENCTRLDIFSLRYNEYGRYSSS